MKTPGAVAVWPLRPALFSFGAKRLCIPPPFPIHGKGGGSGGYTPAALPEIAQPGQAVKGKPPQTADVPPLDCPFPAALQNIRRRGYITTEPIPGAGRSPLDKVSRSGARLLLQVLFPVRLRQFGRLFLFPLVQQRHDLLFHFGRSDLLAEILRQFSSRNNHTAILLFFFT